MTIHPRHLHVDEWIVGDIDGIRYLTEETVDGLRLAALNTAASTHRNNEGETDEYAESLVETVCPTAIALGTESHPRHTEKDNDCQRAPPETTLHLNQFTHA